MKDTDMINRLGFEAWADNLIVNVIEDMKGAPCDLLKGTCSPYAAERDDVTINIHVGPLGEVHATVRAYVPGKGWLYHDRTVKKGERK